MLGLDRAELGRAAEATSVASGTAYMLTIATLWLGCLAIFLQFAENAPELD
jgi:hypothetical protein